MRSACDWRRATVGLDVVISPRATHGGSYMGQLCQAPTTMPSKRISPRGSEDRRAAPVTGGGLPIATKVRLPALRQCPELARVDRSLERTAWLNAETLSVGTQPRRQAEFCRELDERLSRSGRSGARSFSHTYCSVRLDRVDERLVVADHQNRSVIGGQCCLQRRDAVQIEVIGRFVENQQHG